MQITLDIFTDEYTRNISYCKINLCSFISRSFRMAEEDILWAAWRAVRMFLAKILGLGLAKHRRLLLPEWLSRSRHLNWEGNFVYMVSYD